MKDNIFNLKVNPTQKKQIRKFLTDIKKINRYTYPDIIIMALKAFRAGLK